MPTVRKTTRHYRCPRCGFEKTYPNAGAAEARYWFSRHSCRKHEEAALRTALHEERLATIDRTPKPCLHKQADHQHGTRACYVLDRCRCEPCSKANTEAETWRTRQKAYGRYHRYVDAYPVRLHVRELMDAGMGLKQIVKVSGVSQGTLWKLVYGKRGTDGSQTPSRRVLRTTAERLYAIDPAWSEQGAPLADGAVLSAEASAAVVQKLQALVALGWSISEVGRRLGIKHPANAHPVITGERRITVGTAKRAEALFEELSMALPPEQTHRQKISASRARNYARKHGWVPPLALPDLAEDIPSADTRDASDEIDEAAVLRRMGGDRSIRRTPAEAAELVRRWQASGRPLSECERITGINPHRVRRHTDLEAAS